MGSDAWMESYSRRTHVEGTFGNYKSPKTADLQRGWVFIVGMVKTSLMLAAVAVATNIRLLRKWAARTGDRLHGRRGGLNCPESTGVIALSYTK